ncbi:MAG TPA: type VI secretion system contractile sheath large subunit [Pyrinomonadaceae bacterium]|nr:type VI secretion system contractile sheath large subunit [Pyrinomonadaceae bacterium]
MQEDFSLEEFDSHLVATMEEPEAETARADSETPFRIALMGDWSGRANRGLSASTGELAAWRPLLIDRDNLDRVLAKLGARLHLPLSGDGNLSLTIQFNSLEDFHPDRIFERVEMFELLRRTRARLSNPKTFDAAAEEVRSWANVKESDAQATTDAQETASAEQPTDASAVDYSEGSLLDQMLAEAQGERTAPQPQRPVRQLSPDINALVQEAVRPYLVPGNEAEQESLIAAVDEAVAKEMSAILHHADFQALESAWRALDFLVSRLETGTDLKLYLLDISREELAADILSNEQVDSSALYKLLVESTVGTPGGIPWAVVVGNYRFDFTDAEFLQKISLVAQEAGAPFIAEASAHVIGCDSLARTPDPEDWRATAEDEPSKAWRDLKRIPSASYLGLALPRFLLRLPYGQETEPTEEFDFEEMPPDAPPLHDWYLWANPAFAVVYLLAHAFTESGWDMRPGQVQEIEGLPLHIYTQDGESRIKPCAETLMTTRSAERIINEGIMPLISMKDTDAIRLGMFQSLNGKRLAGRWG